MDNRIRSRGWLAGSVLMGALLVAQTCLAQGTGVIYGTVKDPSGAGIVGAKVEAVLTERGTVRAGTTGAAGDYVFSAMPIGTWEVRISVAGFQQFRQAAITLNASENIRVDAELKVGSITESVVVTAQTTLVE